MVAATTRPACGPAIPPPTVESVPIPVRHAATAYPPFWVVQPVIGVSKFPFCIRASAHQVFFAGVGSALPAASTARDLELVPAVGNVEGGRRGAVGECAAVDAALEPRARLGGKGEVGGAGAVGVRGSASIAVSGGGGVGGLHGPRARGRGGVGVPGGVGGPHPEGVLAVGQAGVVLG